jgi:uncharacterized membrane protein (UPF0127 family)
VTTSPATSSDPFVPDELDLFITTGALLDGEEILVAVAVTDATRARGLMGVADLGDVYGMVFVFLEPRETGFWMRDVLIPLDIAFFDAEGGYIDGFTMPTCPDGDCPTYPTPGPVAYAIEAPAGALADLGRGSVLELGG